MLEPAEVYGLLFKNHLPSLTEDDQRLIAARVTGWSVKRIGDRTYRSERTVRDHLDSILDKVCGPLGVDRDVAVLGWWFAAHSCCERGCAARARAHRHRCRFFRRDERRFFLTAEAGTQ